MLLFESWRLLPQRIALHVPSATAVIADVHLGYSAARQRLGDAVPLRSLQEEVQTLAEAASQHDIRALIVAGDLFERGYDAETYHQFIDALNRAHIEFRGLVPGNHDRGAEQSGAPLFMDGFDLDGWQIIHGDRAIENARVVMGHWHPAIRRRGQRLPCFLVKDEQIVLPAFSRDAAGVDVAKDPRWRGWTCLAIDGDMVIEETKKPRGSRRSPLGFRQI